MRVSGINRVGLRRQGFDRETLKKLDAAYRIIFMHRDMREILASQARMMDRRDTGDDMGDAQMARHFLMHLADVTEWLRDHTDAEVLHVRYAQVVEDPGAAAWEAAQFLDRALDIDAMAAAVRPDLYRNRADILEREAACAHA